MKYFFIFPILVFSLTELGLRLKYHFTPRPTIGNVEGIGYQKEAVWEHINKRLINLWFRPITQKEHPFNPPFFVFMNRYTENEKRIDYILTKTKLPPAQSWTIPNFLIAPEYAQDSLYTVSTNSLGYRGPERALKKPEGTFRILVLGSYPAFGHAVNDTETYSHLLEEKLNAESKTKKFEVWNLGKQAAASIMGYTLLKKEVLNYQPDLVIWDYGWIDMVMGQFDITVLTEEKLNQSMTLKIRDICNYKVLEWTAMCKVVFSTLLSKKDENINDWRRVMRDVMIFVHHHKIPFLMLRHEGVLIPADEYLRFAEKVETAHFLDTSESFKKGLTPKEANEFWSKKNWLDEIGVGKEEVLAKEPSVMFYGDPLLYNKFAYRRIADSIYERLETLIPLIKGNKHGRE